MEGVTIAALFARNFRIEPADGADLTVRPMITLRPKSGFMARLAPREPVVLRNTECGDGEAGLATARDNFSGAVAVGSGLNA
jgi:hypothetical protein